MFDPFALEAHRAVEETVPKREDEGGMRSEDGAPLSWPTLVAGQTSLQHPQPPTRQQSAQAAPAAADTQAPREDARNIEKESSPGRMLVDTLAHKLSRQNIRLDDGDITRQPSMLQEQDQQQQPQRPQGNTDLPPISPTAESWRPWPSLEADDESQSAALAKSFSDRREKLPLSMAMSLGLEPYKSPTLLDHDAQLPESAPLPSGQKRLPPFQVWADELRANLRRREARENLRIEPWTPELPPGSAANSTTPSYPPTGSDTAANALQPVYGDPDGMSILEVDPDIDMQSPPEYQSLIMPLRRASGPVGIRKSGSTGVLRYQLSSDLALGCAKVIRNRPRMRRRRKEEKANVSKLSSSMSAAALLTATANSTLGPADAVPGEGEGEDGRIT